MRDGAHATHILCTAHIVLTILTRHTSCLKTSAFALNGSLVAEAMSRQRQAACSHTRLSRQGSNQYCTRVKCAECDKLLVFIHHAAPDEAVQQAMEQRHRWQASMQAPMLSGSFVEASSGARPAASGDGEPQARQCRAVPAVRVARGTIQRRAHSAPRESWRRIEAFDLGDAESSARSSQLRPQQPAAPRQQPAAPGQQPTGTSQQPAAPGQQPAEPAAASGARMFSMPIRCEVASIHIKY